jgi:hypothetical protein
MRFRMVLGVMESQTEERWWGGLSGSGRGRGGWRGIGSG